MGMEIGFDLKHMAAEVAKSHVRGDTSLELGAKGGRDAAEYVSDEQGVLGVGWEEELLEIDLVFEVVTELLIMAEESMDTFVFEAVQTVRGKETVLQLLGPRSPCVESRVFLFRETGIIVEGISTKDRGKERENVAIGGTTSIVLQVSASSVWRCIAARYLLPLPKHPSKQRTPQRLRPWWLRNLA
ncbi:hypothetical protein I309_04081 [Cryptococcus deuterogattii LA55]|nr:hypothetical protein I309_04081 [Cryptococcus deuterogattii LA55]